MENKKSFLLHVDSLSVLDELTDAQAGKLFRAIRAYHLRDAERREQDGDTGAENSIEEFVIRIALAPFKAQFERDKQKYDDTIKKRSEAGKKGGALKGIKQNKQMQAKQANASKCKQNKQMQAKQADSVSDSVNVSTNVDIKEIPSNEGKKKEAAASSHSLDYIKFLKWIVEHAPYCANPKNFKQITEVELYKLKEKYNGQQVADIIERIENRTDLRKKYSNLYLTVLNWAKREYGE